MAEVDYDKVVDHLLNGWPDIELSDLRARILWALKMEAGRLARSDSFAIVGSPVYREHQESAQSLPPGTVIPVDRIPQVTAVPLFREGVRINKERTELGYARDTDEVMRQNVMSPFDCVHCRKPIGVSEQALAEDDGFVHDRCLKERRSKR